MIKLGSKAECLKLHSKFGVPRFAVLEEIGFFVHPIC